MNLLVLRTPKKILKKKEFEKIESLSSSINDIEVKINFNILINDELIKISDYHQLEYNDFSSN
jgi:hypothetical protein